MAQSIPIQDTISISCKHLSYQNLQLANMTVLVNFHHTLLGKNSLGFHRQKGGIQQILLLAYILIFLFTFDVINHYSFKRLGETIC